jgi:hypothetical protein
LVIVVATFVIFSGTLAVTVAAYDRHKAASKAPEAAAAPAKQHAHA